MMLLVIASSMEHMLALGNDPAETDARHNIHDHTEQEMVYKACA